MRDRTTEAQIAIRHIAATMCGFRPQARSSVVWPLSDDTVEWQSQCRIIGTRRALAVYLARRSVGDSVLDEGAKPVTRPPAALSFVIPVKNDREGLSRCLRSISLAGSAHATECIVMDNGSLDGSGSVAEAAGCRVLRLPDRRVGDLRNEGASVARGLLLAFVDADHELHSGWVDAALELFSDPQIAAAGAPYQPPYLGTWVQRAYNGLRDHAPGRRDVDWLGSGNLVVRRAVFEQLGGFDTSLEACEDVDFCRKLRASGARLVSDSRLASVHHGDPRTLRALFRAELWRGRNNLRVSLRERPSLRALPSVLIPVGQLAGMISAAGLVLAGQLPLATLVSGALVMPSVVRAGVIRRRARVPFALALAVACTYDLARALALVWRAGHRRASPRVLAASQ